MNPNVYSDLIENHYARILAPPVESIRWGKGPIKDLPSEFRVLVIPRSPTTVAYATQCMSMPDDSNPIELYLIVDKREPGRDEFIELLTFIAHYHRTGERLGLGDTINFGRPWVSGSMCSFGLLSLPYLDGPDFEWDKELQTRFLWLIPITENEVKFKREFGLEALEEQFERHHFNYLDPSRPSVV